MLCLWPAGPLSKIDRLRSSGLSSASLGFQFLSKLTIGRPGLSLTTVGVGSFGLRSFKRMLVACRISSLLISRPSLVSFSGTGGLSEADSGSDVFDGGGFEVYAGFLDWDGGLRWISDIERFLMGSGGVLFERGIRSWANWTRFKGFLGLMRRGAGISRASVDRPRSGLSCSGSSQICSPVKVPAISPLMFLLALLLRRELP